MNEFEDKPLDFLKQVKMGLESYLVGSTDVLNILKDFCENTINETTHLYKEKIRLCEIEIEKRMKEIK